MAKDFFRPMGSTGIRNGKWKTFWLEWKDIKSKSRLFRTIRDREIYFVEMPEQVTVTRQIQFDVHVDEVNPIYDEIVKLLEKRSIKKDI